MKVKKMMENHGIHRYIGHKHNGKVSAGSCRVIITSSDKKIVYLQATAKLDNQCILNLPSEDEG